MNLGNSFFVSSSVITFCYILKDNHVKVPEKKSKEKYHLCSNVALSLNNIVIIISNNMYWKRRTTI